MKTNLRRLWTLMTIVLLASAGSGCTAKMKKAYHLQRANKFFTAQQYDQAEIEFFNVLRSDPGNALAITRLGLLYFEEGRLQSAAPFLARGSELNTNDLNLRSKLGFIYSDAGRAPQARTEAVFILDRDPKSEDAALLLAESSTSAKDIADARQRIQKLAQNGDRAPLEMALGKLFLHEQDTQSAEASFKRALSLDPKCVTASAALGALYWAMNIPAQAETYLKQSAELAPLRSPWRMQYVLFKIQNGDLTSAASILDGIEKQAPDYDPALMLSAQIAAANKQTNDCAALLKRVLTRDPNNFEAMVFEARFQMALGQNGSAVTTLEKAIRLYPQVARLHFQLAQAYLAVGDSTKAVADLNRAIELDPNLAEAIMLLAKTQIESRNPDPAVVSLGKLVQRLPQLLEAQLLLADGYRLQGRVDDALAVYDRLQLSQPQSAQVALLAGAAHFQQNDLGPARDAFNRALQLAPDSLAVLEQLVNVDLAEKKFAAAEQRVQAAITKHPQQMPLRLLAARISFAAGSRNKAEEILLQTTVLDPSFQDAYLMLAQSYHDDKQNDRALEKLKSVLALNPTNSLALMLSATIQSENNNNQAAADDYEKLLAIDPKFCAALNNLAYLDSEFLGRLDRAYELAQRAHDLLPFDPAVADTLGWITYKKGNYSTALGLFQDSAGKLPQVPDIQYHLGMAYYMLGNEAPARTALQRALQLNTGFPGHGECEQCLAILNLNLQSADAAARTALEKRVGEQPDDQVALGRLAANYQSSGNAERAIATYEKVLIANPQNLAALVNLARLYAPKNPAKAYETAKAAYKLAPDNTDVSHQLGRLAFQAGDYKVAADLLQQTVQSQANDPQIWFDYAQAAYSQGQIDAVKSALQNALQLNLPSTLAGEARRQLDMINLADRPTPQANSDAVAILKTEPAYVPALMVKAISDGRSGDTTAAAAGYEKILAIYEAFLPAQKELALLDARDPAKLDRAYALAVKARTSLPNDPTITKALGLILFQKGDYIRAANLLKQSATDLATDAEVRFYLGSAQFQLKNLVESKANLQQALSLNLAGPQAESARQLLAKIK